MNPINKKENKLCMNYLFHFRWLFSNGWTPHGIYSRAIQRKKYRMIYWKELFLFRRFVITVSLLIFSILFALQLDGYIKINYWLVFLPLFIWKMLVVFGACTGVFFWCKNGERERILRTPDNDCRALIIYFFLHTLIFIFEILTCDKLENGLDTRWIVCFIPLFLCTFLAFLSCLWSLKVQRNFLVCLLSIKRISLK